MAEPTYSEVMEALWASLPLIHRRQDELQPVPAGGFPMKRWLSAFADQVGDVETVIERIDYAPPDDRDDPSQAVSELADASLADAAWLPWLAQILGVQRINNLSEAAQRAAIGSAVSGFRAGTKQAVGVAAQGALTGTKSVAVYDHATLKPGDGGGEWDVLIVTRSSETPGGAASVTQAVIDAEAKPAGVVLHHSAVDVTWASLQTIRPTWADWNGKTWAEIQETGL
jgi:hypothetical protein